MKSKTVIYFLILSLIILALGSCNEAIFHTISEEVKILSAYIKGSPTNFVMFKDEMYVASGKKLYKYNGMIWKEINLEFFITQLAATDTYFYILSFPDTSSSGKTILKCSANPMPDTGKPVWVGEGDEKEIKINNYNYNYNEIQAIYTANNTLYVGAVTKVPSINAGERFKVFKTTDNTNFTETGIKGRFGNETAVLKNEELRGVATNGTSDFICTRSGIYKDDSNTLIPPPASSSSQPDYIRIIKLADNTIAAITRNGTLYKIDTNATLISNINVSRRVNGSIAVCKINSNYFLLVGTSDTSTSTTSGYTHGYREMQLSASGGFNPAGSDGAFSTTNIFKDPGGSISSVDDNTTYKSSIGVVPINHFFHFPGTTEVPDGILFASTQQKGIWSFRQGDVSWNADNMELCANCNEENHASVKCGCIIKLIQRPNGEVQTPKQPCLLCKIKKCPCINE
ncbi:MAG: hypothetical protein FWB86_01915 [Treponema sp.]|nr:hypothetical protein [Treponema sp.]MCL2250916.1 hypothetical protein [Treponema sp.]